MLRLKKPLFGEKGMSLAETLVASGLLLSVVGGLTYMTKSRSGVNSGVNQKACLVHVNRVMSSFTQMGMNATALEAVPPGSNINLSGGDPLRRTSLSPSEHLRGVDDRHRLLTAAGQPGAPILLEATTPPTLRSAILMNSATAAVQAIYNAERPGGSAICNSPGVDYSDSALPVGERLFEANQSFDWSGQNLGRINVTTRVQIETFDVTTGMRSCLNSPVIIIPRGRTSPPEAVAAGLVRIPNVAGAPQDTSYNFHENTGFMMTIRSEYTEADPDRGSINKSCEVSQKFQTLRSNGGLSTPSLTSPSVVNLNGTDTCNTIDRDVTTINFQKQIGFSLATPPSGSVILCRDQSLRRLPMAVALDPTYTGPHPNPIRTELCTTQDHIDNFLPPGPPASFEDGNGPNPINLRRACFVKRDSDPVQTYATTDPYGMNPTGNWVPCEQLAVCNSNSAGPAMVSGVTLTNDGSQVTYNLNFDFDKNHYGCDIKVDAIAVDPAGNMSGIQRVIDEPLHEDATHAPGQSSGPVCWDETNNYFHSTWNTLGAPAGTYYHNCAGGCIPPCAGPGSQTFSTPGATTLEVTADMAGCEFTIKMHGADGGSGLASAGAGQYGEGGSIQFDYSPDSMGTFNIYVGRRGSSISYGNSVAQGPAVSGGGGGGGKVILSPPNGQARGGGGGGASAIRFGATTLAVVGGGGGAAQGYGFPPGPLGGAGGDGGERNSAGQAGRSGGGSGGNSGTGGNGGSGAGRGGSGGDGSAGAGGSNPGLQPSGWTFISGGGGGNGPGSYDIGAGGGGGGGYGGGGGGGSRRGGGGGGGYLNTGETSNVRSWSPTRPRRSGPLNGGVEISWAVPSP